MAFGNTTALPRRRVGIHWSVSSILHQDEHGPTHREATQRVEVPERLTNHRPGDLEGHARRPERRKERPRRVDSAPDRSIHERQVRQRRRSPEPDVRERDVPGEV